MMTATLLMAGCSSTPSAAPPQPLTFVKYGPLRLDVAKVEVVDVYQPPQGGSNVEHLFPTAPQAAVRRWVADRIRPVGPDGLVRIAIMDAKVVEQGLPRSTGLAGLFTKEPSERYSARLEVLLELESPGRRTTGNANVVVERSMTVLEDTSMADRSRAWASMTDAMMADFNKAMEDKIRQHLGQLVR